MTIDKLVIGNFNTSSWSLRSWLLMTHFDIAFEEVFVRLTAPDGQYVEGRKQAIKAQSPSGFVPALKTGGITVWDTLAIAETLAERHPAKHLWPVDPDARAHARAVSAEMHAGFSALRTHHPMDLVHNRPAGVLQPDVVSDVRRIVAIWKECRSKFASGGPFLFGPFTIADAMYAPVVSRFRSYAIKPASFDDDGTATAFMDALWDMAAMQAFRKRAEAEIAGTKQLARSPGGHGGA